MKQNHEPLTQAEVQRRLCRLCAKVAEQRFNYMEAADCFCGQGARLLVGALLGADYSFGHPVLEFIEDAVTNALAKAEGQ